MLCNNNSNFLAWSLSPGMASAPTHATAVFSGQMGQQLVCCQVLVALLVHHCNAHCCCPSIMPSTPFQQHPLVASLCLLPTTTVDCCKIAQTSTGKTLFNIAPGNCCNTLLPWVLACVVPTCTQQVTAPPTIIATNATGQAWLGRAF